MRLAEQTESQIVAFRGKHLTFSQEYVPTQPKNDLELAVWEWTRAFLDGETSLDALSQWVCATLERVRDTPDEYLPIVGVLHTMRSYDAIHPYDQPDVSVYSLEGIHERIQDIWDYMAQGVRSQLASEDKMPSMADERIPTLLERDIRAKIRDYLGGEIPLGELIPWLNNPLLLWEMLEVAQHDTQFYEWVMSIHRACLFHTDSSHTRESEVFSLFSRLMKDE